MLARSGSGGGGGGEGELQTYVGILLKSLHPWQHRGLDS